MGYEHEWAVSAVRELTKELPEGIVSLIVEDVGYTLVVQGNPDRMETFFEKPETLFAFANSLTYSIQRIKETLCGLSNLPPTDESNRDTSPHARTLPGPRA